MPPPYRDNAPLTFGELMKIMQDSGVPFMSKLDGIDARMRDLATKSDVDKLRQEIVTGYVPKDVLEPRLNAIQERLNRAERDIQINQEKADSTLESARRQGELRMQTIETNVDARLKEDRVNALSQTDRNWIRLSQVSGWVAVVLTILGMLLQHVKFQ